MTATATRLSAFPKPAIAKAIKLIRSGGVKHVEDSTEYLVTASDGVTRYVVDAYREVCDCPAGVNGRTCYHLVAAVAMHEGSAR